MSTVLDSLHEIYNDRRFWKNALLINPPSIFGYPAAHPRTICLRGTGLSAVHFSTKNRRGLTAHPLTECPKGLKHPAAHPRISIDSRWFSALCHLLGLQDTETDKRWLSSWWYEFRQDPDKIKAGLTVEYILETWTRPFVMFAMEPTRIYLHLSDPVPSNPERPVYPFERWGKWPLIEYKEYYTDMSKHNLIVVLSFPVGSIPIPRE